MTQIAICISLAGCAARQGDYRLRGNDAPADVAVGMASYAGRAKAVHALRGDGTIRVSFGRRQATLGFALAVHRGKYLRLDLLDPAAGPVAVLLVSQEQLTWYLPNEQKLYRLAPSATAMHRLLRLKIDPRALLWAVMAQFPPDWSVQATADAETHELATIVIRPADRSDKRLPSMLVSLGQYRRWRGHQLPYAVTIAAQRSKGDVVMLFDTIEPNPRLPSQQELFTLDVPDDVEVIE